MYVILSLVNRNYSVQKIIEGGINDYQLMFRGIGDNTNVVKMVRNCAHEWIYDEIGKNKFIDTLEDGRGLAEYKPGTFVLKYGKTRLHIDLYQIGPTGWFFGAYNAKIGYFCAQELDEISLAKLSSVLAPSGYCAPPPPPMGNLIITQQRKHQVESVIPIYDKVIKEIAQFDISKLRPIV